MANSAQVCYVSFRASSDPEIRRYTRLICYWWYFILPWLEAVECHLSPSWVFPAIFMAAGGKVRYSQKSHVVVELVGQYTEENIRLTSAGYTIESIISSTYTCTGCLLNRTRSTSSRHFHRSNTVMVRKALPNLKFNSDESCPTN